MIYTVVLIIPPLMKVNNSLSDTMNSTVLTHKEVHNTISLQVDLYFILQLLPVTVPVNMFVSEQDTIWGILKHFARGEKA